MRKPGKKNKPPLYVQEHSGRNGVTVTCWPLALAKTVKEASHEDSAGFNARSYEGELPQQGLKLFLGERICRLLGGEFS